jgi:hypothetical protein
MLGQILFGSLLLAFCAVVYIVCLTVTAGFVNGLVAHHKPPFAFKRASLLLAVIVVAIVFGHTIVVWIWSVAFVVSGALPNMEESVYFTLVTYTTVGYGDLTLGQDFRVFGTMAAITGLLNFGLSTAFLVAVVVKILPGVRAH